jgi:hypothetical protein
MAIHVCCKCMLKMFQQFQTYVVSALSKCCSGYTYVASVCSKCFIYYERMLQQVLHVASVSWASAGSGRRRRRSQEVPMCTRKARWERAVPTEQWGGQACEQAGATGGRARWADKRVSRHNRRASRRASRHSRQADKRTSRHNRRTDRWATRHSRRVGATGYQLRVLPRELQINRLHGMMTWATKCLCVLLTWIL